MTFSSVSYSLDLVDKAVAIVEDDIILESELRRRLDHIYFTNPQIGTEDRSEVQEQVLEQLIDERLQYRIAQRANVVVTDQEINAAMQNFAQRLQSNNQSFTDYLAAVNVSESQVAERMRRDIAVQKVQQGSLSQRITITPREIEQFLESPAGQQWLQPRFNLGHILLPLESTATPIELEQQANQLRAQLATTGTDFKKVARQFSKGPNAPRGGDLGWKAPDELPELFVQQLGALKPGELTPVFRSNAGFHILKVYQRSGAEPVLVERFKTRHILVKISELFSEAEALEKINGIYQSLQAGADFETLAKEQTDDIASKQSGGDLGWSMPGRFVPAFEQVMATTPVGGISEPFLSPFGWHVLKVEDRRVDDMFETVKRNQVRGILRNQRFEDELQIWILELRERAFIQKIS